MSNWNVIDLFCGAGGLSYGFEKAGFNILLGIDNDAKALETFELNHTGAKSICGDITEITYKDHIIPLLGDKKIDVELFDENYTLYISGNLTKVEFSKNIGVSRPTLDKLLKKKAEGLEM